MHVGVDEGSGLIRTVVTTAAHVIDTVPADALIRGDERVVMAEGPTTRTPGSWRWKRAG